MESDYKNGAGEGGWLFRKYVLNELTDRLKKKNCKMRNFSKLLLSN